MVTKLLHGEQCIKVASKVSWDEAEQIVAALKYWVVTQHKNQEGMYDVFLRIPKNLSVETSPDV